MLRLSATAGTFLVPKLYRHREVYLPDNDCILSDYVLIDARFREEHTQSEQFYRERGYTAVLEQGYVILLKKPAKNSDPDE